MSVLGFSVMVRLVERKEVRGKVMFSVGVLMLSDLTARCRVWELLLGTPDNIPVLASFWLAFYKNTRSKFT